VLILIQQHKFVINGIVRDIFMTVIVGSYVWTVKYLTWGIWLAEEMLVFPRVCVVDIVSCIYLEFLIAVTFKIVH
jgi:hypothetical protein